jgi:hypothetical protein
MARVTSSVILAAGAILLVTWLVTPAASGPPRQSSVDAPAIAAPPEIEAIDREVERLRDRLDTTVVIAPPARDPFQFVPLPSARRPELPDQLPVPTVFEPTIVWPALVAILSSGPSATPTFQAAFEDDAHTIQILSSGASLDGFVIEEVTGDTVLISHPATGRTSRLSLH